MSTAFEQPVSMPYLMEIVGYFKYFREKLGFMFELMRLDNC